MAKLLDQMPDEYPTPFEPEEAPPGPSQTNPAAPRGTTKVCGLKRLDGLPKPSGWINSYEGHKWNSERVEAFSRMNSGGQMNFGFQPKSK